MHFSPLSNAALAAVAFAISSSAHTWVEQMRVIAPNGTFTTDAPGYARSNAKRLPGVDPDKAMVHILPPDGTPVDVGITAKDVMCMPSQQQPTQSSDSPRLKAAPGAMVALRYQENGHVTLPDTNPGKAPNRGTVYVYGTTQPSTNENFLDVFKQWNADGTGGNKKGKLLATENFDDGQCHQVNGGPISTARQQQFPHKADPLMGQDLWCQTDVVLPKDAPTGKPYTLYWVWDWATAAGADPALPKGKAQTYTTCMDVDITASNNNSANSNAAVSFAQGQDLGNAAIAAYLPKLAAGDSNLATPSQSVGGSSGGSVPVSSASSAAAASSVAPAVAQSQPATNSDSIKTVTVAATTVTVSAGAPQVTSTSTTEVPRSTVEESVAANSSAASIPQISLKLTGTATPVAAAQGTGGPYKRAEPSRGSAKFRNV